MASKGGLCEPTVSGQLLIPCPDLKAPARQRSRGERSKGNNPPSCTSSSLGA